MDRAKIGVVAASVAGVVVTVTAGTLPCASRLLPRLPAAPVPDVALSSAVLFHLERIVGLVAGYIVLLVLLSRAWSGQLPSEVSTQGIKYAEVSLTAVRDEAARARDERADMLRRIEAIECEAYRAKHE